jgi:hypothetical protein
MADQNVQNRNRVSVFGIVAALVFLMVAGVGFTGNLWWIFSEATKWTVAGLVAVAGIGLLVSALPRNRARRR